MATRNGHKLNTMWVFATSHANRLHTGEGAKCRRTSAIDILWFIKLFFRRMRKEAIIYVHLFDWQWTRINMGREDAKLWRRRRRQRLTMTTTETMFVHVIAIMKVINSFRLPHEPKPRPNIRSCCVCVYLASVCLFACVCALCTVYICASNWFIVYLWCGISRFVE